MIRLLYLNKLIKLSALFWMLIFGYSLASTTEDIWKKKENKNQQENTISTEQETNIETSILSEEDQERENIIDEQNIEKFSKSVIGIFDPEENNLTLDMWQRSDGNDIKKILKRINNLKLSKLSEDLLFEILFTNSYPPSENLNSEEFLKIKINWLIKNKRIEDLELLLKNNPEAGNQTEAIKFLINESLASADIKSACEKTDFISKEIQNDYLDKFTIYCLIKDERNNEAQLIYDLAKERGLKDKFFENKINFLLGINEKVDKKILDDNLLNFYLCHITNTDFQYEPNDKTNKYIWRYLSSANLIKTDNLENEKIITTYEKAASEQSLDGEKVFDIYKKIIFNLNQLLNAKEIYKNLEGYEARALIYQSILLSDNIENKLYLSFLLKDLFEKDKLFNVYTNELSNILREIDPSKIPESYADIVNDNLDPEYKDLAKIKFDNDIIHRSKVIKHFLNDNEKITKTEKDFKSVYKKIKRNKKYFISIKDIIVLESLVADGINLPKDLNYTNLSAQLTVPQNLEDLVENKQTGLVMLKIVEIIGEDEIKDLDPETIYFLNNILNKLELKKIRNNILKEALPLRV